MLGYNVRVAAHVRQALFSRVLDNDDMLRSIRKPVLITHAAEDAIVRRASAEHQRALIAHAELDIMKGAGHAPFFDDAPAFNRRLATFARDVARRGRTVAV